MVIFSSSSCYFNIVNLDRMKKKKCNPIVGNIGCLRDRLCSFGILEGLKVDNFMIEKIVSSSPLVMLASGRLRFLNLGFDTGYLSFEMSCTFTVQVLTQLDLLRKVTSINSFKKEPSMVKNCCPSSSSSADRLRQEPSMAKNCWSSSSSSAERLRQEPSIDESSHRVLESVIFATFASISFVKSWNSFL